MKLAEDLYVYPWTQPTANNCNTYLALAGPGMLVDPGHAHLYSHVENGLATDQISQQPGLVALTHSHPDHLEAAVRLQKEGALVALHPDEVEYLGNEGRQLAAVLGMDFPEIKPDIFLEEGELELGDEILDVIKVPGHSPGHVVLYWRRLKALFAGDLIFAQGVGRVDFPGGDGEAMKESILRVKDLDLEWVLPGHGPLLKGKENIEANFKFIEQMYFPML
jgi:glyoxylase-like metal-dependent hydrolase (beta-lactamase superfamily II)